MKTTGTYKADAYCAVPTSSDSSYASPKLSHSNYQILGAVSSTPAESSRSQAPASLSNELGAHKRVTI